MLKFNGKKLVGSVIVLTAAAAGTAQAALPAAVGTTLDALEADAVAMWDLAWPFLLAVAVTPFLIKIFKRVIRSVG